MESDHLVDKSIQPSFEEWQKKFYNKTIQKSPEREKEFTSVSFTPIKPLYIPQEDFIEKYDEKI